LETVRTEVAGPGPTTPAELAAHNLATRLHTITSEMDYLTALSSDPASQQAVVAEWRAFERIETQCRLILSLVESQRPRGLRLVKGRAS
jgi:hypothetical protein